MTSSAGAKRCVWDKFVADDGKIPDKTKALVKRLMKEYDALVEQFDKAGNKDAVGAANRAINKKIAIAQSNLQARVEQFGINRAMVERIDTAYDKATKYYDGLNAAQKMVVWTPSKSRIAQDILNQAWNRAGSMGEQALGALSEIKIDGKPITNSQIDGLNKPTAAKDLYRMLRSDADGDKAFMSKDPIVKAVAPKLREVLDSQQKQISAVGAYMGRIDNYTPQTHIPKLLKKHADEWMTDIYDAMDFSKITNPRTGKPLVKGVPADDKAFKRMAQYAFAQITEGPKATKVAMETGEFGSPDLNMRRAHARFFQFKDGDAFLAYNNKYGVGDEHLFSALLSHVQRNGRDIGVMEVLGPRPRGFNAAMKGHMGERDPGMRTYTAMFRELMGDSGYLGDGAFWQIFEGTKNLLRSALLGNAAIAALPDATLSVAGAKLNGLTHTNSPGGLMTRYMRALTSGAETMQGGMAADMQLVSNAANVAEIAARNMGGLGRMAEGAGDGFADWGNKMARFTMDKSGLSHMTLALERTSSYTVASDLGLYNLNNTPFSELNPQLKASLTKAGISPEDWAVAMKADLVEGKSKAQLLPVSNIYDYDAEVGQRFADWDYMLRQEVKNGPDLKMAAYAAGRTLNKRGEGGRGDPGAAIMSSGMMFKSFPIQILRNFTWPMIQRVTRGEGKALLASTVVTSAMLGYISFAAKEKLKGRPWPDLIDNEGNINAPVIAAAFWQAGTAGLVGDHVFKNQSGFGRNPVADFVLGPVGGLAKDTYGLTLGNMWAAAEGDDPKVLKDLTDFARTYTPMQIWEVKALIAVMTWAEPGLEDQYDEAMMGLDPNHMKNKRARERKRLQDFNMD